MDTHAIQIPRTEMTLGLRRDTERRQSPIWEYCPILPTMLFQNTDLERWPLENITHARRRPITIRISTTGGSHKECLHWKERDFYTISRRLLGLLCPRTKLGTQR